MSIKWTVKVDEQRLIGPGTWGDNLPLPNIWVAHAEAQLLRAAGVLSILLVSHGFVALELTVRLYDFELKHRAGA